MSTTKLTINHMYSRSLNIYGDRGNILALKHIAKSSGIEIETFSTEIQEKARPADIYLIGGGQDEDQMRVFQDLLSKKDFILDEVQQGKVFILICGGFQLFGKFFVDGQGRTIEGLGILDVETRALDATVASRCIGNVVVELNHQFIEHWKIDTSFSNFIVGFENHGGQTRILSNIVQPLGTVIRGNGNNSTDKVEGAHFENIIGTYCHGSLLPKNPHITIAILNKALQNKSKHVNIRELDVQYEKSAHEHIIRLTQ